MHYIIYQAVLCAKLSADPKNIITSQNITAVMKTVNYLRSYLVVQHRLKVFLQKSK